MKWLKKYPMLLLEALFFFIAFSIYPAKLEVIRDLYHYRYGLGFPYLTIYRNEPGPANQSFFTQWTGEYAINVVDMLASYVLCLVIAAVIHVIREKLKPLKSRGGVLAQIR